MLSVERNNYARINLADPELELIDPTPNVHSMFIQFDQMFFWTKLASRAVVRWSKRMYSCAGVCSYEGRGGLCDIALSEPLLKLRPRKDLVETLLHEMIHAFLFVTSRDQDRDGHGPNFQAHMHRINNAAGLKISIYHDFHEEVELYLTHWWRCDGPCQLRKPHFGIVRRNCNRPPGPQDYWWSTHQRNCGGTFVKFKEPEKTVKKAVAKPKGDITKYVTTNKTAAPKGEPKIIQAPAKNPKPALTKLNGVNTVVTQKGINTITAPAVKATTVFTGKANTLQSHRVRSSSVDVVEEVRNIWAKRHLPISNKPLTPAPSNVEGNLLNSIKNAANTTINRKRHSIVDLVHEIDNQNNVKKTVKHKAPVHVDSPPVKMKKKKRIDDYFKTTATSLLKDIYGQNIEIAESNSKNNKLIAVHKSSANQSKVPEVDCPICKLKVDESSINSHLDECLNKDIISKICTGSEESKQPSYVGPSTNITPDKTTNQQVPLVRDFKPVLKEIHKNVSPFPPYKGNNDQKPLVEQTKPVLKDIYKNIPPIPPYRGKIGETDGSLNYSVMRNDLDRSLNTMRGTFRNHTKHEVDIIKEPKNLDDNLNWEDVLKPVVPKTEFDPNDMDKVKSVVKKIQFDKHLIKSGKFIVPKEERDLGSGYLPSFIGEEARAIKLPPIKLEPGTSVVSALTEPKCPCCGDKITTTIDEHLEECLAFFGNNDTMPEAGASTSFANHTIVIDDDDDDIFDETQLLNATGTKLPCPCCLQMVEHDEMNAHLDSCLS